MVQSPASVTELLSRASCRTPPSTNDRLPLGYFTGFRIAVFDENLPYCVDAR